MASLKPQAASSKQKQKQKQKQKHAQQMKQIKRIKAKVIGAGFPLEIYGKDGEGGGAGMTVWVRCGI